MLVAETCKCDRPIPSPDGCTKCGKPETPPVVYRSPGKARGSVDDAKREAKARWRRNRTPEQRAEALKRKRERERGHRTAKCVSEQGDYLTHRFVENGQARHSETCIRCGAPNPSKRVR